MGSILYFPYKMGPNFMHFRIIKICHNFLLTTSHCNQTGLISKQKDFLYLPVYILIPLKNFEFLVKSLLGVQYAFWDFLGQNRPPFELVKLSINADKTYENSPSVNWRASIKVRARHRSGVKGVSNAVWLAVVLYGEYF